MPDPNNRSRAHPPYSACDIADLHRMLVRRGKRAQANTITEFCRRHNLQNWDTFARLLHALNYWEEHRE